MTYFSKFPIYITRTTEGSQVIITDLFRRVGVGKMFGDVVVGLIPYTILDGETPEMVSQKIYGTPFNHWILLLVNNIVSVLAEWPLETSSLNNKILAEYINPYGVHHYFNTAIGYIVDRNDSDPNIVVITNFDYEVSVNDAKRQIRFLDPDFVHTFIKEFEILVGA